MPNICLISVVSNAFAFEPTDLHSLLNFEYSLLDDDGKLIKFKKDEDKIPTLNFSIQIVN